jgi:hypothetical protein
MSMIMSQTERAVRASETRFRIKAANSSGREMRVFGLGPASLAVARRAVGECGPRVRLWETRGALLAPPDDAVSSDAWLAEVASRSAAIGKWLDGANTVIIVAAAGESTAAVPVIAKLVQATGALLTGLVVDGHHAPAEVQSVVTALRPCCSMLVQASDAAYVTDMLSALGG